MRAAVLRGRRDLAVLEVPDPPAPTGADVVVRVHYCGLCGTDATEWDRGRHVFAPPPLVIGHELVGIVQAAGPGVRRLRAGDRVVSGAGISCGACGACRSGRTNLCRSYRTIGHQLPGALAELVTVPESTCVLVPDRCPDTAAALAQPLAVAVHAVRRARPGQAAGVVGAGAVGTLVVAALAAAGVTSLLAVDRDPRREATARRVGATAWATTTDRTEPGAVGGGDLEVVLETSGTRGGLDTALGLVRPGGRVVLVGLPVGAVPVDLLATVLREVDLVPAAAHVCAVDLPRAVELLAGTDLADHLGGTVLPLDATAEDGLRPLAEGRAVGKILVDPRR